jgi:hypothetical protein
VPRRTLGWWLLLGLLAGALAGCQTPKEGEVSSIPWNRPQSWEGTGALGGMQPGGGPGGY